MFHHHHAPMHISAPMGRREDEAATPSIPFDYNAPIELLSSKSSNADPTFVDLGETFVVRQFAEDGSCHTAVFTREMVLELALAMKSWMKLG